MILIISADTVVWFIALMLVVLNVLLFMTIMAIRVLAGVIHDAAKKIPKMGGGGGGLMEMASPLLGGLFGGK